MASTYLTRTFASGNRQLWTWSAWIKRSKLGSFQSVFGNQVDGGTIGYISFDSNDKLDLNNKQSSIGCEGNSTRVFRDTNAWYHIVIVFKGAESSVNDRFLIYVNGEQDTFVSRNSGLSAGNGYVNSNIVHGLGALGSGNNKFDGCMSHVHFVDGAALAPTVFGSTDSTTGEWKINTGPSYTAGTNGFFILKDGNSVTDQSTNSNNFTVAGGTLTKTEDCPSDVFCTLNPLNPQATVSFSNGNNTVTIADNHNAAGTFGAKTGKYYYEVKHVNKVGNGWIREDDLASLGSNRNGSSVWLSFSNFHGTIYHSGSSDTTPPSGSNGDIVGCAIDFDNSKIYWHVNGTYISTSGGQQNPATEANPITFTVGDKNWLPAVGAYSSDAVAQANFGNGYFGTTAVSSAGTNASGIGIFEYDVPTGYTALSTKGFNT